MKGVLKVAVTMVFCLHAEIAFAYELQLQPFEPEQTGEPLTFKGMKPIVIENAEEIIVVPTVPCPTVGECPDVVGKPNPDNFFPSKSFATSYDVGVPAGDDFIPFAN